MLVYAISGAPGSGKSYLAKSLVRAIDIRSLPYDRIVDTMAVRREYLAALVRVLKTAPVLGFDRVAIDNLVYPSEIEYLKTRFPGSCVHFHIAKSDFDETDEVRLKLAVSADYCITWGNGV